MMITPIRVLIVDDSALIRTILQQMLSDVPDIQVVGEAGNGQDAVRMALRLRPNVITMDIRMPVLDGLEATRQIMSVQPTPIVVVASSVHAADYNLAFNAIQAGALTVIEKPHGLLTQDYEAVRGQLVGTIRSMANVQIIPRQQTSVRAKGVGPRTAMLHSFINRPIQAIAIGSSTGGPPVLQQIFSNIPKDFSIPILVVQHIMPAFLSGLVEWLRVSSNLPIQIARDRERITPGTIYFAPDDAHLLISPGGIARIEASAPLLGQRPAATRLFQSVAAAIGADAVGVILTGMGEDGADGLVTMSQKGAHIIAQDQASSVVFGMPKAAIERGVVDEVLPPEQIALRLTKLHWHTQALNGIPRR
jgi:two-component system chemotaxis response regulator CheB